MKRTMNKIFVPHKKQNPRPLFWHPLSVTFFTLALLFISGFLTLEKEQLHNSQSLLSDIRSGALVAFTNKERVDVGLQTLIVSETLNEAATLKAQDMASLGYFAHYSPTGLSPWFWFTKAGYEYQKAGENLAVNFSDSKDVVHAWMNSPTHKANIVKDGYTEIGIGTAEGMYKGENATFVVQLFAEPKAASNSNGLVFAIEKKSPIQQNEQSSVRGAEVSIISLSNIFRGDASSSYNLMILLCLLSLLITIAIITLLIKWKHHTKRFYISLLILIIALVISVYTQVNFLKDISITFL